MSVTIYSTHCPQCDFLENTLKQKGIDFNVQFGAEKIIAMGYNAAPLLEVDGVVMTFPQAVRWVNAYVAPSDEQNNSEGGAQNAD